MPLRFKNPYDNPKPPLRLDVNPYLTRTLVNQKTGELPLLVGEQLRGVSGNWRNYFREKSGQNYRECQELVLEIGCYKGKSLVELASACPDKMFIGIDITYKRVVLTAERIKRNKIANAVSVMAHVNQESLATLFAASELSQCLIFFPDPWSKRKQAAHRLMSEGFVASLFERLATNGELWFKTDQPSYYHETAKVLAARGFSKTSRRTGCGLPELVTPFEGTFSAQNLRTFSAVWQKNNNEI